MDTNSRFLLDLLSAYVKNGDKINIPDGLDWEKIYELSAIHCIQGIVYLMLDRLNINAEPKVFKRFEKDFFLISQKSIMQEIGMEKVIKALTDADIEHVLFKGYVLRNYYPVKETRTMGDIDFLINQKDRKKADEILKSIGFVYCQDESYALVWNYINKYVYLEVHTGIVYQMTFSGVDYGEYYKNVFDNTVLKKDKTYELNKEYHFVYLIVHLAKHFYHIGAGIRMFLDISIFVRYFENDLNWSYINRELCKLNLDKFALNVFFICNEFLGGNIPNVSNDIFGNDDLKVLEYILNIGVFGHNRSEDNLYSISFGTITADKKGIYAAISRLKVFFKLVFPTTSILAVGESKWRLPFAWIKRWYKIIFQKRGLLSSQLKGVFSESDEAKKHKIILEYLGLSERV